jgi:RimJ/RimL family protein N-acetyltransferase
MNSQAHLPTSDASMLRQATLEDIPAIMAFERIPEFHAMIGTWSAEEYLRALNNPDVRCFVVAESHQEPVGFVILRGIQSPHRNIELKRFVIAHPGRGLGQRTLHALMAHVFQHLRAHRLWLDVFATNARALHVYRKNGFREDGVFREAIYRDGEFHTLLLFSILDREYAQAVGAG